MQSLRSKGWRLASRISLAALIGLGASLATAAPGSACDNGPLVPEPKLVQDHRHCVSASEASFRHTFRVNLAEHEAEATIRLSRDTRLCRGEKQAFALVSYLAPSREFQVPQYLFDQDTAVIDRDTVAIRLVVEVPSCFTQVDFVFGDEVIDPIEEAGDRYGNRKVGSDHGIGHRSSPLPGSPQHAWFNGGTERCQTVPAVEAMSQCDGSLVLSLRNGRDATATTYAISGKGGYGQTIEVPRSAGVKEITIPAQHAWQVKVSSGETEIGTYRWERPEDCADTSISGTSDCVNGTVTITNPATNGVAEVSLLVEGDNEPTTVKVEPGATKTITVKPNATVSVTVFNKSELLDLASPGSCDPKLVAAAESSQATGVLPVTGARIGLIAGLAVGLLGAGSGLYFLARRRRIRFTAA